MPRGLGPFGGQPQQMPFNPNLRSSGGPPQQFPNAGLQPQVGMQQTGMFMAGGGGPVLPGGMGTGPAAWGFNNVVGQPGFDGAMGGLANGMMGLNPSPRPFGVPLMGMEPEPDFGGGGMPMDPFLLNGQGGLVGGLPPPQGRGGMGVMGLGGMDNITPGGPILNPSMMGSGGGGAGMIDQRAQNLIGGGIARGQYPQGQMPQQPVGPMPFQNLGGIGLGLNTAGLGAPTGNSGSVIPDPMMAQPRPVDDEKNSLKFGMHGLLEVIRASDNKDLQQITLGSDLLGFGLNLNANDPIFPTFAGPFADHGVAADPVFSIPTCYGMQTPPLKGQLGRSLFFTLRAEQRSGRLIFVSPPPFIWSLTNLSPIIVLPLQRNSWLCSR